MNAEVFLQKYRIMEGLLEKRYDGHKMSSSSVVIEYIRDPDSDPVRVDLDLLREIRNILSHNAGPNGEAVVQPSEAMLNRLDEIIAYINRPRSASDYGTPAERIFFAHPNDHLWDVMRAMQKNGYSHVPVREKDDLVGVFSVKCLFDYMTVHGPDGLNKHTRIGDLGECVQIDKRSGERYLFVPANASIASVKKAFEPSRERNNRLGLVFVTRTGSADEPIICMITPWDIINDRDQ